MNPVGRVHRHHENRRRQYGLAERTKQLGWSNVVVVDDDLSISGDGVKRPGFERLLVAICEGHADLDKDVRGRFRISRAELGNGKR
jgi:DNA invertase Pin-like site-specific DNA recombinase